MEREYKRKGGGILVEFIGFVNAIYHYIFWSNCMKKVIQNNLADNDVLWKYMDLPKYLSLLSSSSIWLARSDTFKDKREGVFHLAMKKELENFYQIMSLEPSFHNDLPVKNVGEFQEYLSCNTYISCWHKSVNENMVMWEIYGDTENSVSIKTTAAKLKESFCVDTVYEEALELALDDVLYKNSETLPSEKNCRQPFFLKREHFAFEKEVRLYFRSRINHSISDAPYGYKIQVDLDKLIDQIYVHPDAEKWFFEAVKDLTKKYGIDKKVKKGQFGN